MLKIIRGLNNLGLPEIGLKTAVPAIKGYGLKTILVACLIAGSAILLNKKPFIFLLK